MKVFNLPNAWYGMRCTMIYSVLLPVTFSDLTAATWGGSTAQSETNSTVSYDPNDTQESLELTHTLGELNH